MYYPVAVEGGLLSVGDSHASQGDSELCGTAIECSLNGTFQIIVHKKADLAGTALEALDYPMLETKDEWLVHGFSFANYLTELGDKAQSDIYSKSSVDLALRDAFRKMRKFLMTTKKLTEDEAISLITIGVDFGITQVVCGNWGVHAVIKKDIFAGGEALSISACVNHLQKRRLQPEGQILCPRTKPSHQNEIASLCHTMGAKYFLAREALESADQP